MSAAIRAQVPLIPVSIVGSEEIYPLISTAPMIARALGVPYFPVTPLFPWLGVLGMIPLPSKWIIQFGEAVTTDELPPGAADDPMIVFNLTDQVRETIQHTLYSLADATPQRILLIGLCARTRAPRGADVFLILHRVAVSLTACSGRSR